jgi:hypothetical protein
MQDDNFVEDQRDPHTKKEFDAMRMEYKNSIAMCADFYGDRPLQKKLRMVTAALQPLEDEFYTDMETQAGGQERMAAFAGERAVDVGTKCIGATLQKLHSVPTMQKLGLAPSVLEQGASLDEPWVQEEVAAFEMFYNLVVAIASARAWSQALFGVFMPQLVARLLHPSLPERVKGAMFMKNVTKCVLQAEALKTHNSESLLTDVAWNKLQLTRELFKLGEASVFYKHMFCMPCSVGAVLSTDMLLLSMFKPRVVNYKSL